MTVSISVLFSSDADSKSVCVRLNVDGKNFDFWRESASPVDAFAIKAFLDGALSAQIREVRRVEYLRGYRSGRSKKAKNADSDACTLWIGDWMRKEAGL